MTSLRSTIKPAKVLPLPKLQAHHVKGMLEYTPLCIGHAVHHGISHAADVRNVTIVFVKFVVCHPYKKTNRILSKLCMNFLKL